MNTEAARYNMIYQQIRPWEVVDDRVLNAMMSIPREQFVPREYRDLAFADLRIPIGCGQYMMEPKLEARLLQSLMIQPKDRILEIGSGSGFLSACLALLGNQVVSYEIEPSLAAYAAEKLSDQGIQNVHLHEGDGLALNQEKFDVVVLTGSMPHYDERLDQWLKDGGRLFIILGEGTVMNAILMRKQGEQMQRDYLFETRVDALKGIAQPNHFIF